MLHKKTSYPVIETAFTCSEQCVIATLYPSCKMALTVAIFILIILRDLLLMEDYHLKPENVCIYM